jgi:preprotein translocase subunit SecG
MFPFLLVVHALIAAALVTVILMQRSEGGGLGMGGSPAGLMSARGAADFLTRATAGLATAFVALSIVLAVLASTHRSASVDTSLARRAVPAAAQNAPVDGDPLAGAARNAATAQGANPAAATNSAVPLAR